MANELEMIVRLVLAAVFGAIIGAERERERKPAGLRTQMLICIGSALFTLVSLYGFISVDTSRVAAGIVSGIGFLGAGSILRRSEGFVEGITTAASIWAVAAIGIAVGTGMYLVSAVGTGLILGILLLPHDGKGANGK